MKDLLEKLLAGDLTVDSVLEQIDAADKEKVPRTRLNDKITEIKELEAQLKERDTQLDELGRKAKDSEELTGEINRLKQENADKDAEYQQKLQQQTFDTKLSDALREAKVRNPKAVKALLEADNIKLDGDKLLGLDDQLSALKASDAYLFASEEKPALGGRTPHTPTGQPSTGLTKDDFAKLSYAERTQLFTENPEQFNKLNS